MSSNVSFAVRLDLRMSTKKVMQLLIMRLKILFDKICNSCFFLLEIQCSTKWAPKELLNLPSSTQFYRRIWNCKINAGRVQGICRFCPLKNYDSHHFIFVVENKTFSKHELYIKLLEPYSSTLMHFTIKNKGKMLSISRSFKKVVGAL